MSIIVHKVIELVEELVKEYGITQARFSFNKIPDIKKTQLSNLKANLYKQVLKSLRLNPAHKNIRILLREQLDYATILYNKGLYNQSLKVLEKAKSTALEYEEKYLAYEIVEFEKVIESQYITRSMSNALGSDQLNAWTNSLELEFRLEIKTLKL